MIPKHFIDPIPVKEERDRLQLHAAQIEAGIKAANALAWFAEWASAGTGNVSVTAAARVSAAHHEIAQRYLQEAATRLTPEIIESAIQAARADFENAKLARDPPKEKRR